MYGANAIAYLAIYGFPIMIFVLVKSSLGLKRAVVYIFLIAMVFLPSALQIDFQALPPFDKRSVPAILLLLILATYPRDTFRVMPENRLAKVLLGVLILQIFVTVFTNGDMIRVGPTVLPPAIIGDIKSNIFYWLTLISPMLIGRSLLADREGREIMLRAVLAFGIAHALISLFEVRMAPILHETLYGYFPHRFDQQMRGDGFRPVGFFVHGLNAAFFLFATCAAAATLSKISTGKAKTNFQALTVFLLVVLVLTKSLGALLFALVAVPVILFTSSRFQVFFGAMLCIAALSFPLLKVADLVPEEALLSMAESINEERRDSLNVRFTNEERLVEHARERFLFGWGGWGRNRVYDPITGEDISITDGFWIIVLGTQGLVGYFAVFGLLSLPVIALWRLTRRSKVGDVDPLAGGLCIIVGFNLIELLPNSSQMPSTWLMVGALLGYAESLARSGAPSETSPDVSSRSAAEPRPAKRRTIL